MTPRSRIALLLVSAGLLAGWVAIAAGQEAPRLTVCRHQMADGKDARPVELTRVDREYTKAAKAFRDRMKRAEESTVALRDRGHDSGVKTCTRQEQRTFTPAEPLPPKLWGRRLYFLSAPGGGRIPSGIHAPLEPDAVVFLLRHPSLDEAGKLSERLKVGITPATQALAERLGIRCHTSIVDVSRDGTVLAIQEVVP